MEDLLFKSEIAFDLSAVEEKARRLDYAVEYKHIADSVFLDIDVSLSPHRKQWQWVEAGEATLRILSEINFERMRCPAFGSTYIIHFTPSTISELAQFLEPLLLEYGGWIGLDDEMKVVYDSENIATITENPFFAEMY